MKIIKNFLNDSQVLYFKNLWETNREKSYVNWEGVDRRLQVEEIPEVISILEPLIHNTFPTNYKWWSALQEQSNPHDIHIDKNSDTPNLNIFTYVISLDTVPEFKTIVWKDLTSDSDKYGATWSRLSSRIKKKSDISKLQDLEHTTQFEGRFMCDYLELDGIFQYESGSAALFNGEQLHCTSNWRKYPKFDKKQLLQIHVYVDKNIDISI